MASKSAWQSPPIGEVSDERRMDTDTQVGMNADVQTGMNADVQTGMNAGKQENKQESKTGTCTFFQSNGFGTIKKQYQTALKTKHPILTS